MWNFVFFARRQITGACLFVFFPRGHRIDQVVLECRKRAHSNRNEKVLVPFLSDQKNWRASRPPPTLIFSPKSTYQNFEISILFRIVENNNKYVFGDELLPHNPWGRGCQATNFDECLNIVMVIGEVYRRFQGDFSLFGDGAEGRGYVGGSFLGGICHGEEKFNEKGADFSSITIRKQWKINMKTFFQMKRRSSIET